MSTAARAIDAILADPLARSRDCGAGVGFVGLDYPQDVAFALPAPALHLPWRADRPVPFADRWLESSFPGWARSIVEDWSTGAFDALTTVVFSRGDDASQRLYYYVRGRDDLLERQDHRGVHADRQCRHERDTGAVDSGQHQQPHRDEQRDRRRQQ